MDYNRWNGDASAVRRYFRLDGGVVIPEPPEPPKPDYLFVARFRFVGLAKRDKPKTGTVVGYVLKDETVKVYEVDKATGWYRVGVDQWCSGWSGYWQLL